MKKYFVIGNPIGHSLSPKLHNYWIKKNNLEATYEKEKLDSKDLKTFISKIKNKKIIGANVTVPFKKEVIPYLEKLTTEAKITQSVNTILLSEGKLTGHNTDIIGFEKAIRDLNYDIFGKKVLILGSGGVVSSIIFALYKMNVLSVTISNRTKSKAVNLQNFFNSKLFEKDKREKIMVVNWGEIPEFDIVINATSVGLKKNQKIDLDFTKIGNDKFFYDVIYNPTETNFLRTGKNLGHKAENGKKMFIFQAAEAFKVWNNIQPEINQEVLNLLDD